MKTKYLFHAKYRNLGWMVFIPASILGFVTLLLEWEPAFLDVEVLGFFIDEVFGVEKLVGFTENNILNEILGILVILSGLTVAFSREPDEDEMITKIRLESLVWATYWNYGILVLAFLFLYDLTFYWVMVFNMFTILYLFIIRFTLSIRKLKATSGNEEYH
ncbi:hypothetical protein [Lentiprolixibacter aurantiacus]|uniref:Uncharacterized protein n=1 Tax=Lentiprolixibacter aurantiacus TaxID=2993939 RepID=A0AAE3MK92_9FLAO|nr:hypothetical protein [Lentiprolixibacter aurantiacus]MCX2718998.1 hypothetical protein [Lentiprolixibacter aurantiacus]